MNNLDALHARAKALGLHGLLAHWHDATAAGWLHDLIEWEEQERARRSLERRLKDAHIGRFKPLCDFDWAWPKAMRQGRHRSPDVARIPQRRHQRNPGRS